MVFNLDLYKKIAYCLTQICSITGGTYYGRAFTKAFPQLSPLLVVICFASLSWGILNSTVVVTIPPPVRKTEGRTVEVLQKIAPTLKRALSVMRQTLMIERLLSWANDTENGLCCWPVAVNYLHKKHNAI